MLQNHCPGRAKITLPLHGKRLLNSTSPTPPTSMMAVGRSVLERAKKTLVYVLRRLLTSCAVIIEEGGVGGQVHNIRFSRERFFCTTRNQNIFIMKMIGKSGLLNCWSAMQSKAACCQLVAATIESALSPCRRSRFKSQF